MTTEHKYVKPDDLIIIFTAGCKDYHKQCQLLDAFHEVPAPVQMEPDYVEFYATFKREWQSLSGLTELLAQMREIVGVEVEVSFETINNEEVVYEGETDTYRLKTEQEIMDEYYGSELWKQDMYDVDPSNNWFYDQSEYPCHEEISF